MFWHEECTAWVQVRFCDILWPTSWHLKYLIRNPPFTGVAEALYIIYQWNEYVEAHGGPERPCSPLPSVQSDYRYPTSLMTPVLATWLFWSCTPFSQRVVMGAPLRVNLSSRCSLEDPKTVWGAAELRFCREIKSFSFYPSGFLKYQTD